MCNAFLPRVIKQFLAAARAIAELEEQVRAAAESRPARAEVYPHPIAFNVLPQVDAFLESGYTKEEMKMQNEGRRIMHHPEFCASVTCVRVPVYRAHSVAVSAEFSRADFGGTGAGDSGESTRFGAG